MAIGCAHAGDSTDAGPERRDGGAPRIDAGPDARAPVADAGTDAGSPDCASDDDCTPLEWCRFRDDGGHECVPRHFDGEECGDVGTPWLEERCVEPLECVSPNPDPGARLGRCAIVATLGDLLDDPSTYDGRTVAVLEGPVAAYDACTGESCPRDMPCCESCEVREALGEPDRMVLLQDGSGSYRCIGSSCTWMEGCVLRLGSRQRVMGTFFVSPPPDPPYIRVDNITELAE